MGEKFLEMNISSLELSSEYPITKYAIPDEQNTDGKE